MNCTDEVFGTRRVNNTNGHVSTVVNVKLTRAETGTTFTTAFLLVKEDGQWRICD